jgi:hypothetical protein
VTGPGPVIVYHQVPPGDVLDGCVAVYRHAFGQRPYGESRQDAESLPSGLAQPPSTHRQNGWPAGSAYTRK